MREAVGDVYACRECGREERTFDTRDVCGACLASIWRRHRRMTPLGACFDLREIQREIQGHHDRWARLWEARRAKGRRRGPAQATGPRVL